MDLYPAVDIRGGSAVRLMQGDFDRESQYGDPVALATRFADAGAPWLHVVDLDAARSGRPVNRPTVLAIAAAVDVPVETGGGVRSEGDVEELLDVPFRTHSPAGLDRDIDGGGNGQHRRAVHRTAGTRRVEIDHVQPRRTGIGEPGGQSHRVSVLALPVEVTLHQPDGGATPDVDGRIEVHHADASSTQRTKLARMPSPTAPDFSGWNWVPHTAPRSAEAVTAPPYSQVDVVSAVRSGATECTK